MKINSKPFQIVTSKTFRNLTSPHLLSPNQITWSQQFHSDFHFSWRPIWKNVWKVPCPQKWNQSYFMLLQRGHPHGDRALRNDLPYPPNYYCPLCPNSTETLNHIFLECSLAQGLWKWMKRTWKNASGDAPPINLFTVLNGGTFKFSKSISQDLLNTTLKIFHRAVIHTLWRARCDLHHGKQVSLIGVLAILVESIKTCITNLHHSNRLKYHILLAARFSTLFIIQNNTITFNF